MNAKQAAKHALFAVGLEPAWRATQRVFATREMRRDGRDMEHLRVLLATVLSEDSCCVDIGASFGDVIRRIVELAPRGQHIAYEPIPAQAELLRRRFPDVDVRQRAVADLSGTMSFSFVPRRPAISRLAARSLPKNVRAETIEVEVETLDDGLPKGFVPRLIKIDVEGSEAAVLRGAARTIVRDRPVVVFEHARQWSTPEEGSTAEIFDLLCRKAQLRLFDLDGNGPLDEHRFHAIYARGDRWNFVALQ